MGIPDCVSCAASPLIKEYGTEMSVIIDYAFTNNKDVEREQILLSDISTKITRKNTDNRISNVLSNSANQGVVPQSGVFDREIANEENISNYIVISYNDFVYNPRKSAIAPYRHSCISPWLIFVV